MRNLARVGRAAAAVVFCICATPAFADVFVNEIHYDNDGTDANERVEIAGPAGTSLAGWKVVLYNGGDGTAYATINLSGTLPNQCGGHGTLAFAAVGMQNGAPDGLALVDAGGAVVQLLGYEGTFTATAGAAAGRASTAIPVSEGTGVTSGQSLQLRGSGTSYAQFTWAAASTASFGACNTGQTFGTPTDAAPTVVSTTPAANATGVAANANVAITFSESVTLAAGWYGIACASSGSHAASVIGSGANYTIDPSTDYAAGEQCTVTITGAAVRDIDGTPTAMSANHAFSFTVAGSSSTVLQNGVPVTGIGGAAGVERRYTIVVPSGASDLVVQTSGGNGDADLYVRYGSAPTTATYDCRPYKTGNAESCPFAAPAAGTWHVMVRMYDTVANVTLSASYTTGPSDAAPTVASTQPAQNASNHPVNGNVVVTFSEPVSLAAGWYALTCGGVSKSATQSGSGATYTLDPTADFAALASCSVSIVASKVTDVDGTPNAMAANYTLNFQVTGATSGYYASVNASSAATLRATLHPVIDDHTKIPYTASGTDTWSVLEEADEDPLNPSRILDIYKNASYAKVGGGGTEYNREHTWPKSYGFPDDGANVYPYTDTHMLMLSDIDHNAARGNLPFNNCPAGSTEFATIAYYGQGGAGHGNYQCGGYWQVWDKLKGNVARALFYFDVRYEGGTHGVTGAAEPDLRLTDSVSLIAMTGSNASVAYMGLLSALLQWHEADPVDERERLRNEVVYVHQGNRNPFVDHPEWAACLFQNVCP